MNAIGNVAEPTESVKRDEPPVYDRFNGHLEEEALADQEIEGDEHYQDQDIEGDEHYVRKEEEHEGEHGEDHDEDHDFFDSEDEDHHHGNEDGDADDEDAEVVSVVNGLNDEDDDGVILTDNYVLLLTPMLAGTVGLCDDVTM